MKAKTQFVFKYAAVEQNDGFITKVNRSFP